MHQDGIRPMFHGGVDQGLRGADAAYQAPHLAAPFNLQTIGCVVLIAFGLEQIIQVLG
jgi:hypothetical protein